MGNVPTITWVGGEKTQSYDLLTDEQKEILRKTTSRIRSDEQRYNLYNILADFWFEMTKTYRDEEDPALTDPNNTWQGDPVDGIPLAGALDQILEQLTTHIDRRPTLAEVLNNENYNVNVEEKETGIPGFPREDPY